VRKIVLIDLRDVPRNIINEVNLNVHDIQKFYFLNLWYFGSRLSRI
jgi:hypothetical protein